MINLSKENDYLCTRRSIQIIYSMNKVKKHSKVFLDKNKLINTLLFKTLDIINI